MKHLAVSITMIVCLFLTPALSLAGEDGASPGEGRRASLGMRESQPGYPGDYSIVLPAPVVNRVLDLLDGEVALVSGADGQEWESDAFDTSQATRIGLKIQGQTEQGPITCQVCWRFGPDDPFVESLPSVRLGVFELVPPIPDPGDPIGDPLVPPSTGPRDRDTYPGAGTRQRYPSRVTYPPYTYPYDFSEIRGMKAKVRCRVDGMAYDYGQVLGDDPSLIEVVPVTFSGTLTDVKVLLRRE